MQREDPSLISLKVNYTLNHFLQLRRSDANPALGYDPKALFVADSRRLVLAYKAEFDRQLSQVPLEERFEVVASFSPFEIEGRPLQETDPVVNGRRWATYKAKSSDETDGPVAALVEAPEVKMAIVAEKLRTGFDLPSLGAMYIDTFMEGSAAVQTLGRLSRTRPGKGHVAVIDFANSPAAISRAFAKVCCPSDTMVLMRLVLGHHDAQHHQAGWDPRPLPRP